MWLLWTCSCSHHQSLSVGVCILILLDKVLFVQEIRHRYPSVNGVPTNYRRLLSHSALISLWVDSHRATSRMYYSNSSVIISVSFNSTQHNKGWVHFRWFVESATSSFEGGAGQFLGRKYLYIALCRRRAREANCFLSCLLCKASSWCLIQTPE